MQNLYLENEEKNWELTILDADPPSKAPGSLIAGDFDKSGNRKLFIGGEDALLWYCPKTREKGIVAKGSFHVGLLLEDIDNDGMLELIAGMQDPDTKKLIIAWHKFENNEWKRYIIDNACTGSTHDIIFIDIDGDGKKEIIANAMYSDDPGLFIYKPDKDITSLWKKYTVQKGYASEGLAVADFNNDGKMEIILGPHFFTCSSDDILNGEWRRSVYAPGFREMCRTALADITGNGRPDIVIVESEYINGRMSWFENRMTEDPENPWIEHPLDSGMVYAHSFQAKKKNDSIQFFLAEMAAGGWWQPVNWNARLILYSPQENGKEWNKKLLYKGAGTHQALMYDIDDDGRDEIVGKEWGDHTGLQRVQIWKKADKLSPISQYKHQFIDRDKPYTGVEIFGSDVNGNGLNDIICGTWWYKNPTWKRFSIPDIYQIINVYDIDGDGKNEYIALKPGKGHEDRGWYGKLSSILCWVKPVDPENGKWEIYDIGTGSGDWPHGSVVGPFCKDGKLALTVGYHDADEKKKSYPEIFEMPDDPKNGKWKKRILAKIAHGEEMIPYKNSKTGNSDIIAGPYYLENNEDGEFKTHKIIENFDVCRIRALDINGNGRKDLVAGEEALDFEKKHTPFSRLAWFECPEDPANNEWKMHVIDKILCAHSIDLADLDGDGEMEIICGEHDPFSPYRTRCRLLVYKKADPEGISWKRYVIDDRFEHHDGAKVIDLGKDRKGIISHGWQESLYVHLWKI